jgi:hypothetical protein
MTPWVLRLLVANVAVFFLTAALPRVGSLLALWPSLILYRPWGIVTYMFVHAGFWHLFFNMLGIFFFGPRLELQLGGRSFMTLYLLSGLGGAAFSFLFAPHAAVVGASGAVFGILLGFAYFWPKAPIYIWGVLPVQARWLVIVLAACPSTPGSRGADPGSPTSPIWEASPLATRISAGSGESTFSNGNPWPRPRNSWPRPCGGAMSGRLCGGGRPFPWTNSMSSIEERWSGSWRRL